ncbi:response regulator [Elusimicrobiota bacterium]
MELNTNVLIAEDDPIILEHLYQITDEMDLNPIKAKNGKEAIKNFKKYQPGVVILDFKLPDTDGDKVLNKIKKMRPITQAIMITGHGDYDVAVRSLQAGATEYIRKPFNEEQLIEVIKQNNKTFNQMYSAMELINILVVTENKKTAAQLKKNLNRPEWMVTSVENSKEALEHLKKREVDILIQDLELPEVSSFELLDKIKHIPVELGIITMTKKGDEDTAINALKRGALSYIRNPEDISKISVFVDKAIKYLEFKRISKFRVNELEDAHNIIAKVKDNKYIELDVLKSDGNISSSFARRFFDSVPLGIIAADEKNNIIYYNNYFKRKGIEAPKKVDENFISLLQNLGIKDVNLNNLLGEIFNLFSSEQDIETTVLGRKQHLTLTRLKVLAKYKHINAVLLIVSGN